MKTAPLIAPLAVLALISCKPDRDDVDANATASSAMDAIDNPVVGASTTSDTVSTMTPLQFVNTAAASDTFEIETSRLAVQSASKPAVRDFAKQMVDAHSASSAELKSIATGLTPRLTPMPDMSEVQKGRVEALKTSGEGFDGYYIDRQIEAHEQALAMLKGYAGTAAPGPLRDFAAKMAPKVAEHLAMARKLPR